MHKNFSWLGLGAFSTGQPFLRASLALLLAAPLVAQVPTPASFTAGRGSWFDDINWSGGLYPGSNTAATVDNAVVRLNARGLATPLVIQSLTLLNEAEADVRDARLQLDDLTASNSTVRVYASHLLVTRLHFSQPPVTCIGFGCGTIKLNPSLVEAQEFTLNGTNVTTTFGLGGTNPATADGRGPGHHARVVCDTARLDGSLAIEFLYGFVPQAGQQFEIIRFNGSGPINGQFINAPEGALVARYNSVGLYLTYLGGDGNDVVLTAQPLPGGIPPLVHATNSGNWFDPLLWSDGQTPTATKEHILLARQVGLAAATPGQTAAVKSLSLREGAVLQISNTTFQAESLDSVGSSVNVARSHVQLDDFHILRVVGCIGTCGGIKFNPSLFEAGQFTVDEPGATLTFGLGGTNAATATGLGAGHYARVVTDRAQLDGNLAVEFLYGFTPSAGQQFEIIRNHGREPIVGRFANVREGGAVAVVGDLMLVLSYVGGDGNDLVLTAVPRPALGLTKVGPGTLQLSFNTARGHFYTVESTAHLAPAVWSPLPIVLGDGTAHTTTTTNSGSGKFHRLFGDHDGN